LPKARFEEALLGPSGCGKSTLLRLIAGLEPLVSGEIYLKKQAIHQTPPAKRNIAMVFQNYALYPHMSVRDNLKFPLKMAKVPKKEQEFRVQEMAELLELDEILERKPSQLSGGQKQRVAVGRALIRKPALFLLDEPLSNLDAKLRQQLRLLFKQLQSKLGITTLYVTHDHLEAMTLAHRIVLLKEGKIQQIGTPLELYQQPVSTFVASFLGTPPINFFSPYLFPSLKNSACQQVGIRPEHLYLSPENEKPLFSAHVLWNEPLGSETLVTCELQDKTPFTFKIREPLLPLPHSLIVLGSKPENWILFDEKGQKL
jgi:ABC-type sugar transport system ATPase subunit